MPPYGFDEEMSLVSRSVFRDHLLQVRVLTDRWDDGASTECVRMRTSLEAVLIML